MRLLYRKAWILLVCLASLGGGPSLAQHGDGPAPKPEALAVQYRLLKDRQAHDSTLARVAERWASDLLASGMTDSALAIYRLVIRHADLSGLHEKAMYAHSVLGETHRIRGHHKASLFHNLRCAEACLKIKDHKLYSSRLGLIGDNYYALGQVDSAEFFFKQNLRIKEEIRDTQYLAVAYHRLGIFYVNTLQYGKSLSVFMQGLSASEIAQKPEQTAMLFNNIAEVLAIENHDVRAVDYARRALLMADSLDLKGHKVTALNTLGNIAEKNEDLSEALIYYQDALTISLSLPNHTRTANQYLRLANFFQKNKQLSQAEAMARQGAPYLVNIKDQALQMKYAVLLGELALAKGELPDARKHLQDALKPAQQLRAVGVLARVYQGLSDLSVGEGRYPQALEYLQLAQTYRDSANARRQSEYVRQIEASYQSAEKERQIRELKTEAELSALRLRNSRHAQWLLSAVVIAAVCIALLGFFLFFQKKKNAEKIAEKNMLIEKALADKDMLLREIHHRVKNNLQIISSLLNLQSKHIKDQGAFSAVTDSRTRVRSMALIHQNLYMTDSLSDVNAKEYLHRLCAELFETYKPQGVSLQLKVEDINMDVDAIISLGLIVNELVSNALKYAFASGSGDTLALSLQSDDSGTILRVRDNGAGFDPETLKLNETFGYKLIRAFVRKLDAELHFETVEMGSSIVVRIPRHLLMQP
ncbi:MAG: histidine kinase dimerization/phosphoacceptor domain -containing protein [Saprospiraceae bacterium]